MTTDIYIFQYQKGAIKTRFVFPDDLFNLTFQYQKGAIKTKLEDFFHALLGAFNTKKVRLKLM